MRKVKYPEVWYYNDYASIQQESLDCRDFIHYGSNHDGHKDPNVCLDDEYIIYRPYNDSTTPVIDLKEDPSMDDLQPVILWESGSTRFCSQMDFGKISRNESKNLRFIPCNKNNLALDETYKDPIYGFRPIGYHISEYGNVVVLNTSDTETLVINDENPSMIYVASYDYIPGRYFGLTYVDKHGGRTAKKIFLTPDEVDAMTLNYLTVGTDYDLDPDEHFTGFNVPGWDVPSKEDINMLATHINGYTHCIESMYHLYPFDVIPSIDKGDFMLFKDDTELKVVNIEKLLEGEVESMSYRDVEKIIIIPVITL